MAERSEMSRDRAVEIVKKCLAHAWVMYGLNEEAPPSLQEYSLAELVEANRIIGADRELADGRCMMNCDDRLVAALYVAYHNQGDDPDDKWDVKGIGNGNIVLVLKYNAMPEPAPAEGVER